MLAWFMAAFMAAAAPSGLEEARDREDRGALQLALTVAAAAAAQAPNDPAAHYRVAQAASYLAEIAQIQRDKPLAKQAAEQGIKAAERAVALKPAAENYRLLGVLYGQAVTDLLSGLSYGPRAKIAINKAVELAPNSAAAYVARGVGNYYVPESLGGGAKVAIPDLRKAVQLDPKNAEAYLWLGIALHKDKQDAEARQALAKSLTLNPNRLWAKQVLEKIK
jgi:tetratricopeptide (TPR) repeat protein